MANFRATSHRSNPELWDIVDNDPDGPAGWEGTEVHWKESGRWLYGRLVQKPGEWDTRLPNYPKAKTAALLFAEYTMRDGRKRVEKFWYRRLFLGGRFKPDAPTWRERALVAQWLGRIRDRVRCIIVLDQKMRQNGGLFRAICDFL